MLKQDVNFIFHYAGGEWEVNAKFSRFSETPSADYDDEWQMDDIEIIGYDGADCHGELKDVFVRKWASTDLISLASFIEKEAEEKL